MTFEFCKKINVWLATSTYEKIHIYNSSEKFDYICVESLIGSRKDKLTSTLIFFTQSFCLNYFDQKSKSTACNVCTIT